MAGVNTIIAGDIPAKMEVPLTRGADYLWGPLAYDNGNPWEDGTVLTLEFATGQVFTAVMGADGGTFNEENTVTDEIRNGTGVRLRRIVGGFKKTLAIGVVTRYDD